MKIKTALALLLMLVLIMSSVGCSKLFNDKTPDPNIPGNNDPSEEDPQEDPGDDPTLQPTDNSVNAPVTQVPQEAVSAVSFAVIRKGDLWLGTDKDHLWRQTDSALVSEAVWAPDGHALAFLTKTSESSLCSLYTLVPGESPVLVDSDVLTISVRNNWRGFLWSPDSSQLAYAKMNGKEIVTVGPQAGEGRFLIDLELEQGPYWLANDRIAYSSTGERPSLVIVNTMGDVITTLADTSAPFPIKDGFLALTGEHTPDGLTSFFYTGLVHGGINGDNVRPVYAQSPEFCLYSWNPQEPSRNDSTKYFALSTASTLSLQKYAGSGPQEVELLTQDVFLTYSEFSYPFWFSWAPDGNSLGVLRFTLTQEGEYGEQEGVWDLGLVDREGNWQLLQEEVYSVSGDEYPIPFLTLPISWAPSGSHINYLVESSDGDDLWQINVTDKKSSLFIEDSSLPVYRP